MNLSYSLRHWLFTLALGPLLLWLVEIISVRTLWTMRATIELFPLIIFVSLVYSVPLLLLHFTVLYLLNRFKADPLLTKLILVTVTIAGIYITMEYLTGIKIQAWTYSYSLAAVVTGLLIRIKEE